MEQKNSTGNICDDSQDTFWMGAFKGQMLPVWMLCWWREPQQAAAGHTGPATRGVGPETWGVLETLVSSVEEVQRSEG